MKSAFDLCLRWQIKGETFLLWNPADMPWRWMPLETCCRYKPAYLDLVCIWLQYSTDMLERWDSPFGTSEEMFLCLRGSWLDVCWIHHMSKKRNSSSKSPLTAGKAEMGRMFVPLQGPLLQQRVVVQWGMKHACSLFCFLINQIHLRLDKHSRAWSSEVTSPASPAKWETFCFLSESSSGEGDFLNI